MLKRLLYAMVLSLACLWIIVEYVGPVKAADQTTTMLQQLQASVATLTGKMASLDAKVTTMSDQARLDRTIMLRRLTEDEQKINDLSSGMADLDAFRQNQTVVSIAARLSSMEAQAADAKHLQEIAVAQAKADHDNMMSWVRPSVAAIFTTLLSVLATLFVGHVRGRKADEQSARVEEKVDNGRIAADEAFKVANDYKNRESHIESSQGVQDRRLDAIEKEPKA
jgi:TolA-binding protein